MNQRVERPPIRALSVNVKKTVETKMWKSSKIPPVTKLTKYAATR